MEEVHRVAEGSPGRFEHERAAGGQAYERGGEVLDLDADPGTMAVTRLLSPMPR
jgi:hypothetical protein